MTISKFLAALVPAALLLGLALGAAELAPALARGDHQPVVYYRALFTFWVTLVLLTVAFSGYILQAPVRTAPTWLLFWTFAYVTYLCHLCWAVPGLAEGNLKAFFSAAGDGAAAPVRLLGWPYTEILLVAWWLLDVLLGWSVGQNGKLVQVQRGLIHVVIFLLFPGTAILLPQAGRVGFLLGLVMVLAVLSCFAYRLVTREMDPGSLLSVLYVSSFRILNRFVPWHRLPTPLAVMNLGALRDELRAKNLHNTSDIPVTNPAGLEDTPPFEAGVLMGRQVDGYYNDLKKPTMGSGSATPENPQDGEHFTKSNPGARFARNVPVMYAWPDAGAALLTPSPRTVSRRLLARDQFKPATTLNLLAAAWIQFQIHDWFFHGEPISGNEIEVPLEEGDEWGGPMRVRRTRPDPTRLPNDGHGPPTYCNAEGHWWDGSQVYGSDPVTARTLRTGQGGELRLAPNGTLAMDPHTGTPLTGFTGNWWAGLSLLHTLFTREHNAICGRLRQDYPGWDDERLFQTARLVNAALMAKIHTVEWTPAIVAHPALEVGMPANWWGLAGKGIKTTFGRISANEAFSGIPGSVTNHHSGDYAFTEEFVAVYRMHPLMPDEFDLCSVTDGAPLHHFTLPTDFVGADAGVRVLEHGGGMADVFYSFGICHPGKITLRNYPAFLRRLTRPDGEVVDVATIDVLRDRERGVPRYNQFRQLLHKTRVGSFEALCADPELARELKAVYQGDIDRVDLMVGMYAETPPEGFGFSDTAFRIFILMASRRLKSDRFFTTDFTEEMYTPAGMDWLNTNTMRTVLLRHYPILEPALRGADNAFKPWQTIQESAAYQPHENEPQARA
jgi:hypothetical protein